MTGDGFPAVTGSPKGTGEASSSRRGFSMECPMRAYLGSSPGVSAECQENGLAWEIRRG
jgi:hypothetical protein